MQTILYEQPWIIGVAGGVVVAVSLFVWLQLASRVGLYVGVVAAAITFCLILLNIQIVTDREQITRVLYEVATALRENDQEKVFAHIHPNAVTAVQRARAELPNYKFSDARVTQIRDISVTANTPPPTAVATFMVVVDVGLNQMQYKGPRLIRVYFMQRDGKWLVRDYQHTSPVGQGLGDQSDAPFDY